MTSDITTRLDRIERELVLARLERQYGSDESSEIWMPRKRFDPRKAHTLRSETWRPATALMICDDLRKLVERQ